VTMHIGTATTTAVTAVKAPSGGDVRTMTTLTAHNTGSSSLDCTIRIKLGADTTKLAKPSIDPDETFVWTEEEYTGIELDSPSASIEIFTDSGTVEWYARWDDD